MNSDTIWQIVRYILIAAGTWVASKGYVSAEQWETVVGALGAIFAVAWGVFVKSGTKAVPADVANQAHIPTVSGATGKVE
jgi:hypothetical protein